MATKRFLIAPINKGAQKNVRPWLLPENAFSNLENMVVFRDRVKKKFGTFPTITDFATADFTKSQLSSRMRYQIGTTDGSGNLAATSIGTDVTPAIGQLFSCGDIIFTVYQDGATYVCNPVTGGTPTATGSFDFGASEFTIAGGDATIATTDVYFYPALPIMGIITREQEAINDEQTIVFDTTYSYYFDTTTDGWERIDGATVAGDNVWTGTDADFFWGTNLRFGTGGAPVLLVTNFVYVTSPTPPPDAKYMRYYDGTNWTTFRPIVVVDNASNPLDYVDTARCIVYFQGRVLLFNTKEYVNGPATTIHFANRVRYSGIASPDLTPISNNAWLTDPRYGGFEDAASSEQIMSVEILKGRCIVYFERSTFELTYTGNDAKPFQWQLLNNQFGARSTFAVVPFDKFSLTVGENGITACNSVNVERIDQVIPDRVWQMESDDNASIRTQGIRDYFSELVYWTYSQALSEETYPTQILCYNYQNQTFTRMDDSITALGYFQFTSAQEAFPQQQRAVLAGNQTGFVSIFIDDLPRNYHSLQITDVDTGDNEFTVIDHNLVVGDYVAVENAQGLTLVGVAPADPVTDADDFDVIFRVSEVVSSDVVVLENITITGTYRGGGTLARVSKPVVQTKDYNFFKQIGVNIDLTNIDFNLEKTTYGEFTIDVYPSTSTESVQTLTVETRPYPEEFYPLEQVQVDVWHRAHMDAYGTFFQLKYYFDDEQLRNTVTAWSEFTIHGMLFTVSTVDPRLQ